MASPLVRLLPSALVGARLLALAPSPLLAQGQPAPGAAAMTHPLALSEPQVRGFLDAMDDFKALAGTTRSGGDVSKPAAFAKALPVSGEPLLNAGRGAGGTGAAPPRVGRGRPE